MAQLLVWCNAVAEPLLEFPDLGKASFSFSRPDGFAVDTDLKNTAGPGQERHPTHILVEGGK